MMQISTVGDEGIEPSAFAMLAPLEIVHAPCWDRTNSLCNVNATLYH